MPRFNNYGAPLSVIGSGQAYYGLANDAVLLNKSDGAGSEHGGHQENY